MRHMAGEKKAWSDLTAGQKLGVIVGGFVQVTLLALAQWDLTRRPADQVKGPKLFWRFAVLVNFIGPIAYFVVGRKRDSD